MSLPFAAVTGSIHAHWVANRSESIATVLPSAAGALADPSEWIELSVTGWTPSPTRIGLGDRLEVLVTANCFARLGTNHLRGQQIAARFAEVFHRATIIVTDPHTAGNPLRGRVRFGEATVRDRTTEGIGGADPSLLFCSVTLRGRGEFFAE